MLLCGVSIQAADLFTLKLCDLNPVKEQIVLDRGKLNSQDLTLPLLSVLPNTKSHEAKEKKYRRVSEVDCPPPLVDLHPNRNISPNLSIYLVFFFLCHNVCHIHFSICRFSLQENVGGRQ